MGGGEKNPLNTSAVHFKSVESGGGTPGAVHFHATFGLKRRLASAEAPPGGKPQRALSGRALETTTSLCALLPALDRSRQDAAKGRTRAQE